MAFDQPTFRGSREELITELQQAKEGWQHLGKPRLAEQAERGVSQLQSGESSAQVGHTTYVVTD